MKKINLLFILLFTSITFINASDIKLDLNNNTTPRPRVEMESAMVLKPVFADISDTELYLEFTSTVGIVEITVTNSCGIVVNEYVNTNIYSEVYFDVEEWEADEYKIEIKINNKKYKGSFSIY